jgi:hypothetical protein
MYVSAALYTAVNYGMIAQYKRSAFRGYTSKIMVFTVTSWAIKVIF